MVRARAPVRREYSTCSAMLPQIRRSYTVICSGVLPRNLDRERWKSVEVSFGGVEPRPRFTRRRAPPHLGRCLWYCYGHSSGCSVIQNFGRESWWPQREHVYDMYVMIYDVRLCWAIQCLWLKMSGCFPQQAVWTRGAPRINRKGEREKAGPT